MSQSPDQTAVMCLFVSILRWCRTAGWRWKTSAFGKHFVVFVLVLSLLPVVQCCTSRNGPVWGLPPVSPRVHSRLCCFMRIPDSREQPESSWRELTPRCRLGLDAELSAYAGMCVCSIPLYDYIPDHLLTVFITEIGPIDPSYLFTLSTQRYHIDDLDLCAVD